MADVWRPADGTDPWLPERLAATAGIVAAERAVYDAAWRALDQYRGRAQAAVLAPNGTQEVEQPPDAAGVLTLAAVWATLAAGIVAAVVTVIAARLGAGSDDDPQVVEHVAALRQRLTRIPDRVYTVVYRTLRDGATSGDNLPELRARVRLALAREEGPWRGIAVGVARDEAVAAYNLAALIEAERDQDTTGRTLAKRWMCVAPDTEVSGFGVTHAARRSYKGALVRITTAFGLSVSLTPEHQVLTGRGWVCAGELRQDDYLFRVGSSNTSGAPEIERNVPTIAEVVDPLMDSSPTKMGAMRARMYLNGDSRQSYVDVIRSDAELSLYLEAEVAEKIRNLRFVTADSLAEQAVLGVSTLRERLPRHGNTARTGATLEGLGMSSGGIFSASSENSSLRPTSQRNIVCVENTNNCWPGTSEALCESGDTQPIFDIEGCNFLSKPVDVAPLSSRDADSLGCSSLLGGLRVESEPEPCSLSLAHETSSLAEASADGFRTSSQLACDFDGANAGFVQADDVIKIERYSFSGHVYDLSTWGEWYVSGGLVVHNSTHDTRVRETHADADGQTVPLGAPFTVGGHNLMYPGDPTAPASERANCRCSLRPVLDNGRNR